MTGLNTTFTIPEESSVAYLRNLYSDKPITVPSYSAYPEMVLDAIHQTKTNGVDTTHLALAKKTIETRGLDLDVALAHFKALGGTFVISPLVEQVRKDRKFEIHLRPEDFVIPICHEGMNRSQIMFLVACALKSQHSSRYRVSVPHGAESGFDPHCAFSGLTRENWFAYIHGKMLPFTLDSDDWLAKCFYQKFGVTKSRRAGQIECEAAGFMLNPDESDMATIARVSADRTAQRAVMDELLYDADFLSSYSAVSGRIVVITFCRAASIFLHRLLEVSGDKNLSNIVIVSLPYPDEISRAGGADECTRYKATTGIDITRDALHQMRLEETFAFYASILKLVVSDTA